MDNSVLTVNAHPPNHLVKMARQTAGLKRAEAACRARVNVRFLRRVENGDGYFKLTPEIKARIAKVLETPTELLFPEVPDEG
jgi:DNA-binding XRE family transcriptional regulator